LSSCGPQLCRDDEGLWKLQQLVRSLPGVIAVRMLQEIKVHKIRFTLPPLESDD